MQPPGRRRIHRRKAVVQRERANGLRLGFEALAKFLVRRRGFEQAAEEGLQVERRPADEQGRLAPGLDVRNDRGRPIQPPGDRCRLPGIEDVDQMVRDKCPLRRWASRC